MLIVALEDREEISEQISAVVRRKNLGTVVVQHFEDPCPPVRAPVDFIIGNLGRDGDNVEAFRRWAKNYPAAKLIATSAWYDDKPKHVKLGRPYRFLRKPYIAKELLRKLGIKGQIPK